MQITLETFRNATLINGNNCGAHTFPYIESKNPSAKLNMRLQRVKLVKIKFSIAINVESNREGNRFNRMVSVRCTEQVTDGVCCGSAETIGNISKVQ
jgi:hypothetical protein